MQAPIALPAALAAELAELGARRLLHLSPEHCAALLAALSLARVRPACAADAFAPLPLEVSVAIASLLPVGERLLLALLSRAFRALVAEPGLWRVVDLSPSSGVERVSEGLLRAVVAAARGSIQDLDISEQSGIHYQPLASQAVCDAVAASARSLRRLNVRCTDGIPEVTPLSSVSKILTASPQLQSLYADVVCTAARAGSLLTGEAPYRPLCVRRLTVVAPWSGEAPVLALARGMTGYASLERLDVEDAPLQAVAVATAVVDAAFAGRLTALTLVRCSLTRASVPALARLCGAGCIKKLMVQNNNVPFLDGVIAPLFCTALRASKLAKFWLCHAVLWGTPAVGTAVVAALVAHPSITSISLDGNGVDGASHAAGSLAVLLAANTPALTELLVRRCALGDAGMLPIVQVLRGCTHLRFFDCSHNGVTQPFARDELLPAVTANASLRTLYADCNPSVPELAQAEALVAARPRTA